MATAPRQVSMAMGPHQAPMAMAPRQALMRRRARTSRHRLPQTGTQLITNGPQANPGDVSPSWSAQRNVAESEQYDKLLKGNPAFRQARMHKECGPITDPQLHRQCLDSFARY
jgi:hypothetical protein